MRKPKEEVSVEKLDLLSAMLSSFSKAIAKTVSDCKESEIDSVMIEGWPTLVRGLQFMIDQGEKIVGPVTLAKINPEDLLMPGQSFAATRKQSPSSKELAKDAKAKLEEVRKLTKKSPKK